MIGCGLRRELTGASRSVLAMLVAFLGRVRSLCGSGTTRDLSASSESPDPRTGKPQQMECDEYAGLRVITDASVPPDIILCVLP